MTDVQVRLAGEDVLLLPERALFWPRAATLVAADFHWGKGATFRAAGIPVPVGATGRRPDPARRRAAPDLRAAPGDSRRSVSCPRRADRRPDVGGTAPLAGAALGARDAARSGQPRPPCRRSARRSPNQSLNAPAFVPPFILRHEPSVSADGYTLAGHLHPGIVLAGPGRCASISPASVLTPRTAVLPDLRQLHGVRARAPESGDRIFVIADDEVVPVA